MKAKKMQKEKEFLAKSSHQPVCSRVPCDGGASPSTTSSQQYGALERKPSATNMWTPGYSSGSTSTSLSSAGALSDPVSFVSDAVPTSPPLT